MNERGGEGTGERILVDGARFNVEMVKLSPEDPSEVLLRIGGRVIRAAVESKNGDYILRLNDKPITAALEIAESSAEKRETSPQGPALITSPMAGKIAFLKASPGTAVKTGQALLVLVAMKMENEIASPKKGVLKEVYVQPGTLVKAGDRLALVE